ncbi:immunoglobulin-like domain-containing protein [Clostridium sp.]|uniref:immunoglobulin-like domain-containing protein n=1 Tax=Clostridium sp. TaxID=1506 RepID=UPI002A82665D|nr:immunoglobulin-like domain-containing protein [Clostridium sp.]MDY4250900.1 DUF5011 domain-containing protein [Clostridium sp.]
MKKKKINPSLKGVLGFTIAAASAATIIYATPEIIKTVAAENNAEKIILDVKNVDEDTIKVSLDNIEDIPKAFQFSIKLDGIVPQKLDDGNIIIKDLIKNNTVGNIITDYIYNESDNTIDVLITSEKSINKIGNKVEIFELDIEKDSSNLTRNFTVLPTENYEYKYVSNTNKEHAKAVEVANEKLAINTAPTIERINNDYIEINVGEKIKLTSDELSKYILANDKEQDVITFEIKDRDDKIIQEFTSTTAGIYDLYVAATDSFGAKSESLNIQVKVNERNQNPVITKDGVELKDVTITAGEVFNLLDGVNAVDAAGNTIAVTVACDKALNLDPLQDTVYTLTYTATDGLNRTTEKSITLTVKANNAPIILGVKDHTLIVGDEFDPSAGVEVIDEDKDIKLVIDSNVNTKLPGVYKVIYTATDNGNKTARAESIVVVNPKMETINSIPVINANDVVIQLGEAFNNLAGVTATDKEDGEIKDIAVVRDNVDINVAGKYQVTYSVTDKNGASATKTINVIVNDPPQIIAEDKIILLGKNFDVLSGIKATDKEDGDITKKIEVIENNVNINEEGSYTVIYSVVDDLGGKATKTITVTVKTNIVLAESITINNKINNLYVGSSKLLTATIDEKADIKNIEWTTSDEEIASIKVVGNDVIVTANKVGQVTISAKTKDGSNKSDSVTIDILKYEEHVKDFIKDIIDTNVVIPVLGTGTADSPLEMEVQNVTIEKYDEFISKLEGLDPILVEKYEDSEAIFYKIKVKDKSIISKLTNIFSTSTSDEGHIILKIAKNLDNSDYLLAKLDHILASKDNSGDITTPGEDNSDESNNSNEDIKDSQNSNINKLPITGKESILAYLSLISIAIGTVLYKKRK